MKPTVESIKAAIDCADRIEENARMGVLALERAKVLFESGCPKAASNELALARDYLGTLRRSQTAALANIDAALDTAEVSTKGGVK